MADHLVIFEPALFEGRSEAVIAAAKKSAPGKPIRHSYSAIFTMII